MNITVHDRSDFPVLVNWDNVTHSMDSPLTGQYAELRSRLYTVGGGMLDVRESIGDLLALLEPT